MPATLRIMKPKPFHRSMTFWLGLPGLLFLLWSWHDSMTHDAGIFRSIQVGYSNSPGYNVVSEDRIGHSRAGLVITVFEVDPGPDRIIGVEAPVLARRAVAPEVMPSSPFPSFQAVNFRNYSRGRFGNPVKSLFIPHWMILIAYGIAWGAAILWRQGRIRRAGHANLNPGARS